MDSDLNTNRKGFLKRAGLAIAGVFALSSTTRLNAGKQAQSSSAFQPSAVARVKTAKGAVARKA